jgi:hypothetical protein
MLSPRAIIVKATITTMDSVDGMKSPITGRACKVSSYHG